LRIIWVSLILMIFLAGAVLAQAPGPAELIKQGQEIFANTCADCHRLNGEGLPDKFPALNGDPYVLGDPNRVIATVLNGRHGLLGTMPTWKDKLDDNQIAAAVSYIRQAWSNQASPVTPAMVAALRGK
jgi:cytochrome c6